jgi:hypothetical protein
VYRRTEQQLTAYDEELLAKRRRLLSISDSVESVDEVFDDVIGVDPENPANLLLKHNNDETLCKKTFSITLDGHINHVVRLQLVAVTLSPLVFINAIGVLLL